MIRRFRRRGRSWGEVHLAQFDVQRAAPWLEAESLDNRAVEEQILDRRFAVFFFDGAERTRAAQGPAGCRRNTPALGNRNNRVICSRVSFAGYSETATSTLSEAGPVEVTTSVAERDARRFWRRKQTVFRCGSQETVSHLASLHSIRRSC